ncbi:leucyl/phenylalanyl-tRNA-protein transferase [Legionella busanensis]|uniref:Leucyl/phenylalanyl-tRNA--protein transferase n=1 Tax=Legionella busanensis TaxID=190655 RepID=A0A378JNQ7_9GAMM|nr:leucyl/phenylalanyl-tRNA--protein transferase [Legionella busanensis]STX51923.1 leucyl/phenylalanyl-tRNA-protein transferase [Legionella busanensis]
MAIIDLPYTFPDPEKADDQGLLAVGGDLSPTRLLAAYSQGIFPWFDDDYPILWWSPNPRLLLIPQEFKVSPSLKKSLKKPYLYTFDKAFEQVIDACASVDKRATSTWITHDMQQAYIELHRLGYAHSVEIWSVDKLIGGLYGISLGKAFFGESMFHKERDTSKIALFYLCQLLSGWHFDFIDCQLPTPHLQSLGAIVVSRHEFLKRLHQTLQHPTRKEIW